MTCDEFKELIRTSSPSTLAGDFLVAAETAVFGDLHEYASFKDRVTVSLGKVEFVAIVGSGNWRYSLNPDKNFRSFSRQSDIDVAVVSSDRFHSIWEDMRRMHRQHYYGLSQQERERLKRNGENVYSGFISPLWVPDRTVRRPQHFQHKRLLNMLSDASVGHRDVKMLFFKSTEEAVDYYARGFVIAKRKLL
jgi:hypothetical protein